MSRFISLSSTRRIRANDRHYARARVRGIGCDVVPKPPASTRREALMTAAIESAGDIIEITTPDARYEYVNPAFERVLGFALEEVVGRTPGEVIRSDMHDAAYFRNIDETLSARSEEHTSELQSQSNLVCRL